MGKVIVDMSMSLDGLIDAADESRGLPPGAGIDRLHHWLYELESWRRYHGLAGGETSRDAEVLDEAFRNVGAVLMGRRMFDASEEPWGDNPPFHVPVFVLTHRARDTVGKEGGTTFFFVTDGIESALSQARAVAGDKDVSIAGGANVIQQYLRAGLLDEIQIHLVPVLLGGGTRLFDRLGAEGIELEGTRVIESPGVTHLRFRVVGPNRPG